MYKISVIIPIYNAEKYLKECLQSVVNQTIKDIEIICIDDGSNDGTGDILRGFGDEYNNILVYHKNRGGAASARNFGLDIAKGEFIAFLDSDDYYVRDDSLEYLYNLAKKNQVNIAGGNFQTYSEEKKVFDSIKEYVFEDGDKIIKAREYYYPWFFWRFIYKREMLLDKDIRFPKINREEDPSFLFDVMLKNENMAITSKQVIVYRVFDKEINIYSKKVVCDFARGNLQLMHMSKNIKTDMQEKILKKLFQNNNLYIAHINLGNNELYSIIKEIGNSISDVELKEKFTAFWKEKNVKNIYDSKVNYREQLRTELLEHKDVIIYGAGIYGKRVFNILNKEYEIRFVGFAITQIERPYELIGYNVKSIKDYSLYKDTALVIIAKKGEEKYMMELNAKKEGYKHIYMMDDDLYFYINQLTDDLYYV